MCASTCLGLVWPIDIEFFVHIQFLSTQSEETFFGGWWHGQMMKYWSLAGAKGIGDFVERYAIPFICLIASITTDLTASAFLVFPFSYFNQTHIYTQHGLGLTQRELPMWMNYVSSIYAAGIWIRHKIIHLYRYCHTTAATGILYVTHMRKIAFTCFIMIANFDYNLISIWQALHHQNMIV
ncbi:hypothetical protein ACJX0J_009861, partial [Zea mays]